jgi:Arc/MetJ family transcription regulator
VARRKRRRRVPGPRLHRLRRPARLASAQAWIASGARVTVRTYAKRYGVDRYTAHDELTMLDVRLEPGDAQWATRPPPVPKSRPRRSDPQRDALGDGNPPDWIEWGGERIFVVGYTSGGCPYGLRAWEYADMAEPITLELDQDLSSRAQQALGTGTIQETVEEALRRAAESAEGPAHADQQESFF